MTRLRALLAIALAVFAVMGWLSSLEAQRGRARRGDLPLSDRSAGRSVVMYQVHPEVLGVLRESS